MIRIADGIGSLETFSLSLDDLDLGRQRFMTTSILTNGDCDSGEVPHILGEHFDAEHSFAYRLRVGAVARRFRDVYEAEQEIGGTTYESLLWILEGEGTKRRRWLAVTHVCLISDTKEAHPSLRL